MKHHSPLMINISIYFTLPLLNYLHPWLFFVSKMSSQYWGQLNRPIFAYITFLSFQYHFFLFSSHQVLSFQNTNNYNILYTIVFCTFKRQSRRQSAKYFLSLYFANF